MWLHRIAARCGGLAEVDTAGAGAPATTPVINLLGPSLVAS